MLDWVNYIQYISTQTNIPSLYNLPGQNSIKFLGGILENFQTSKRHSEINWPLVCSPTGRSTERSKCALNILWVMSKLKWGKIEFKSFWHANFRQLWEKSTQKNMAAKSQRTKKLPWQIKRIHRISIPKKYFWNLELIYF